jgi:enoyl-CoA hydratase/carnithine racemase
MLITERSSGVEILTLNRPDQRNAFNVALYKELTSALRRADADSDVAVVVVTGAGSAFCAGTDLGELAETAAGNSPEGSSEGFPSLLEALMSVDVPILAAVNGAGVGLGFTMLSFCDLVFMAETARLKAPFPDMGVPPEAASSYLFPLRMGWQRAARTLLLGEWMSAQEALAAGMATEVVAPGRVLERAVEVARQIAAKAPGSGRTTKRLMLEAERDHIRAARAREDAAYALVFARQPEV